MLAAMVAASACAEPQGRGAPAWSPGSVGDGGGDGGDEAHAEGPDIDPIDTTGVGVVDEEGGDEGFSCNGDDAQSCMCPDGPGTGVQFCDGGMWGPCMCDGGTGGGGSTGAPAEGSGGDPSGGDEAGSTGMPEPPPPTEVCYPGEDGSYTTCFDLVYIDPDAAPADYVYPAALGGDPNYRRPVAYLDLEAIDGATKIAPNFRLDELAQAFKGPYGIVQVHAVESLQALRDAAGALNVNSGYRSPAYNLSVGGATYSRHMYGDGFDLDPVGVTIAQLQDLCEAEGGMLVEYETHVHCDFRFDDVDVEFFGPAEMAAPVDPGYTALIVPSGVGFAAVAMGFDEGEPVRRWIAIGEDGRELARAEGRTFAPPGGTRRIEAIVGTEAVRVGVDLERRERATRE